MVTAEATKAPAIWKANKGGQWLFLSCPFWEALSHGDRGGGKTTALLAVFLSHIGKGYGSDWRGALFRLTYPQLKDVIDISRGIIPKAYPGAKFNKVDSEWTFEEGETLLFRPLENLKAYDNFHGHSFPFLGFEELCNWPNSEAYEAMLSCSRLRSSRRDIPRIVRGTTNAWGVGHSWVKNRFVDGRKPFVPYGVLGRQRIRIPIQWRENLSYVSADPDYHVRLAESITNEAQRKAWLEDSWDIVAGGRFSDVWLDSVHYIEPFNIPRNWSIDRSFDWGSSKPFCTLWYAESNGEALDDGRKWPRGTIFVIHEDYGCAGVMGESNWKPNVGLQIGPNEIGRRVNMHEQLMIDTGLIGKRPQPGPADDPMFDVSRGTSLASQMYNSTGVIWYKPTKGRGSRVTGWQLVDDRLLASRAHPMEAPGLFVFNTCRHLRRTLPVLPRDPKNPDDVQSDTEDHVVDALKLKMLSYARGPVVRGVSL